MARTSLKKVASNAELNSKTQIGQDSMVGEGSRIGERCSIKKTVIGNVMGLFISLSTVSLAKMLN